MSIKTLGAAALTLALTTGSAFATGVLVVPSADSEFDFVNMPTATERSSAASYDLTSNGIDLTFSASRQDDRGNLIDGKAKISNYRGYGIGVCSYLGWTGSCGETHQIDNHGEDEVVVFEFDQDVSFDSVSFTFAGPADAFSFSVFDAGSTSPSDFRSFDLDEFPTVQTYNFETAYTGRKFGIGASGEAGHAFKIRSIVVSAAPDVSEVPVPAAAFLFAPALMGFLGLRRKAKQA